MGKQRNKHQNKVPCTIQLDQMMMEELKQLADFEERSISSIIRQSIKLFLKQRNQFNKGL